jgi:hypothetical protein
MILDRSNLGKGDLMNLELEYTEYMNAMRGIENKPANLNDLLLPFGILGAPMREDEFLLVGHILDALPEAINNRDLIAPDDVIEVAFDLGMSSVA